MREKAGGSARVNARGNARREGTKRRKRWREYSHVERRQGIDKRMKGTLLPSPRLESLLYFLHYEIIHMA